MHTTAIIKFQVEQALLLGKAFLKQQQLQQAQEQYNIQKKINIISITNKTINIDNFFIYGLILSYEESLAKSTIDC